MKETIFTQDEFLEHVNKLEQQNADLVAALETIDKKLRSQQGLDYSYWSQAEKDIHDIVKQALAKVGKND